MLTGFLYQMNMKEKENDNKIKQNLVKLKLNNKQQDENIYPIL